ncbi:hypothetical protein PAUR_b0321 [Pseudoalteromonas aurantia 208]|uniref:Orphan protein n=1 Tax=Pseudoalteromonas aurantia 208 TaxID=1314867 RepID=A0ABR9EH55_9GAMM|nr:hypothetical protein [Pseudoalteromonas aurantia 208]
MQVSYQCHQNVVSLLPCHHERVSGSMFGQRRGRDKALMYPKLR